MILYFLATVSMGLVSTQRSRSADILPHDDASIFTCGYVSLRFLAATALAEPAAHFNEALPSVNSNELRRRLVSYAFCWKLVSVKSTILSDNRALPSVSSIKPSQAV